MRIHSDILTYADFSAALKSAGLTDVWVEDYSIHASQSRKTGHEIRIAAAYRAGAKRRPRNTGRHGAEDPRWSRESGDDRYCYAATYDEHGLWMAQLFAIDPDAIVGPYKTVSGFNQITQRKYQAKDWRQTSCRFCGHDVEGDQGSKAPDWRDRGNNTHCADGKQHSGRMDY